MISREGSKPTPANTTPRTSTGSVAALLKEQFRKVARAVVTTLAPSPAKRRKRREETEGAFKLARTIVRRVKRSIFTPWHITHVPTPFDEAEYFLRRLLDEWAQEDHHEQAHDESFHYGTTADFDPHL